MFHLLINPIHHFLCLTLLYLLCLYDSGVCVSLKSCLERECIRCLCLQQFLYPSEEDMYELIRFLVGRLSESVVVGEANDVSFVDSKDKEEDWFRDAARGRIGKISNERERLNWWRVEDMLREIKLNAEGPKSSCATGTGSGNIIVNNMSWQEPIKESGPPNVNSFGITDSAADANDQVLEGNAAARETQSSQVCLSTEFFLCRAGQDGPI